MARPRDEIEALRMRIRTRRAPSPSPTSQLPLVVDAAQAPGDLASVVAAQSARWRQLLLHHGAILFRGYDIVLPLALSRVIRALHGTTVRYIGGISPRRPLYDGIYTSTELPPSVTIPLHSELSYFELPPRHLWFACAQPAARGGETLLADTRAIARAMPAEIRERFVARGVRYHCSFHGPSLLFSVLERFFNINKSWMDAFETEDRTRVEDRCRELGAAPRWLPSGRLAIETVRPALVPHPESEELVWLSSAHLFRHNPRALGWTRYALSRLFFSRPETRPQDATYADGGIIDRATLDEIQRVIAAEVVPLRWQRGDVLWIDNHLCMHGRKPFRGQRRLLAAMTR
jgi:alpha-ketoglutarate-dependent taurine dioxygenase